MNQQSITVLALYHDSNEHQFDQFHSKLSLNKKDEFIFTKYGNPNLEQFIEITEYLVLFVNKEVIDNAYLKDKALSKAFEKQVEGTLKILLVILEECNWEFAEIGEAEVWNDGEAIIVVEDHLHDNPYQLLATDVAAHVDQLKDKKDALRSYFDDKNAWEKALQLHSINAFERYIRDFPDGHFIEEANTALSKLR